MFTLLLVHAFLNTSQFFIANKNVNEYHAKADWPFEYRMCCILNGMQVITSRVARLPDKEPCTYAYLYVLHCICTFEFIPAPIKNFRLYLKHFTKFCIKWCISVRLGAITKYEPHWPFHKKHKQLKLWTVCGSLALRKCSWVVFNEHCSSWIRILRRSIHSHSFHHD